MPPFGVPFSCTIGQPVLLHQRGDSQVLEPGALVEGWVWLSAIDEPRLPGAPRVTRLGFLALFERDGRAWGTEAVVPTDRLRPGPEDKVVDGFPPGSGRINPSGIGDVITDWSHWPEVLPARAKVLETGPHLSYDAEAHENSLLIGLRVLYQRFHYIRPLASLLFDDLPLRWEPPTGAALERAVESADARLIRAALTHAPGWQDNPQVVRALALIPVQRGRPDLVDLALALGMSPQYRLPQGGTLLHFAVIWKNEAIARRLLLAGVDPNAYDDNGDTALHLAIKTDQHAIVEALLSSGARDELPQLKSGVSAARMQQLRALHRAADQGDVETVERMLAASGPESLVDQEIDGLNALLVAAKSGHAAVIEKLASATTNLDRLSSTGTPWNALQCAVAYRHIAATEVLLRRGADPNVAMPAWSVAGTAMASGRRPLHLAGEVCCRRIARLLLDAGAEVNALDADGETALTIAARNSYGHKLTELLLERGADASARTRDGQTPLDRARRNRLVRTVAVLEGR